MTRANFPKLPRREPVAIEARRALTLAREVEVLRRFVVCAGCGIRLQGRGTYDYDHEIPLALGGRDEPGNLRPYCRAACHPAKTAQDIRVIAKAKRLAGETGAGPSARPLPQRRDHIWPSRPLLSRPLLSRPLPSCPLPSDPLTSDPLTVRPHAVASPTSRPSHEPGGLSLRQAATRRIETGSDAD